MEISFSSKGYSEWTSDFPFIDNLKKLVCHPTYSWNIMCQKWEGDCGLWVLNEIVLRKYAESLKKIVGAVWELLAK